MNETEYKGLFKQIAEERFKRKVNFEIIENSLIHLRRGEFLTYKDLIIIANDKNWPFNDYWIWPTEINITDKLINQKIRFNTLPNNQEEVINQLNSIFKNISLASIILRFVFPEYYGIYSLPVLRVLKTERGFNETEEYLNYIDGLKRAKYTFGIKNIATADMIVWALAYGESKPSVVKLKELLKKNLPKTISITETHICDPLTLANKFYDADIFQTAGLWAAAAFDKLIESIRSSYTITTQRIDYIKEAIEKLYDEHSKWEEKKGVLEETRRLRNKAKKDIEVFLPLDAKKIIENLKELHTFYSVDKRGRHYIF